MIKNVEKIEYKYNCKVFQCDNINCNRIINDTNEFNIRDLHYCPYCGYEQGSIKGTKNEKEKLTLKLMAYQVLEENENYTEDFAKGVLAFENKLENEMRNILRETE